MEKIKKYLLDFFTAIGGLAVIWEYVIKPLYSKPKDVNLQEYYLHNWSTPLGIVILVIVILITLKRLRALNKKYEEVSNYAGNFVNVVDKMIAERVEALRVKMPGEFAPIFAAIAAGTGATNKSIKNLDDRFNQLNADFASFSLYQQGNVALVGGDFKGAYSNYILSVEHSIKSDNQQNISRALRVIGQNVLPNMSKEDVEMLKKDKKMDIEDMFKQMTLWDEKKVFVLDIQDLRMAINRLPDKLPDSSKN